MSIATKYTDLIGRTPLMRLEPLERAYQCVARLLGKLEYFNPAGSIKDRAALYMILDAERRGKLKEGATIVEPTSGNTGIGLAAVAAGRGYRVILTMPDTMSVERRALLAAYGAHIVLTDGARGMTGAIERAEEIAASISGAFIPGQFSNPANALAHFETTGPEIWEDTGGKVDALVSGVGTGGTITGAGGFFKTKKPHVKIVAVEPADSPLLSEGWSGPHPIQGIGANFVPVLLDRSLIDEVITVTGEDAMRAGRDLARRVGILAGISSGAALWAATRLARRAEYDGKTIVVILPDTGERYLSSGMFSE